MKRALRWFHRRARRSLNGIRSIRTRGSRCSPVGVGSPSGIGHEKAPALDPMDRRRS